MQLVPRLQVREEVAHPEAASLRAALDELRLRIHVATQDVLLRLDVRVVEEVVDIRDDGHCHGQRVEVQQLGGLAALHVGELVEVTAWQHEEAVLLPLERPLGLTLGRPYGAETSAFEDVDDLVERELESRQRRARWDLRYARLRYALLASEHHDRGIAFPLFPGSQRQLPQVFDEVFAVDGNVQRVEPPLVEGSGVPEVLNDG